MGIASTDGMGSTGNIVGTDDTGDMIGDIIGETMVRRGQKRKSESRVSPQRVTQGTLTHRLIRDESDGKMSR